MAPTAMATAAETAKITMFECLRWNRRSLGATKITSGSETQNFDIECGVGSRARVRARCKRQQSTGPAIQSRQTEDLRRRRSEDISPIFACLSPHAATVTTRFCKATRHRLRGCLAPGPIHSGKTALLVSMPAQSNWGKERQSRYPQTVGVLTFCKGSTEGGSNAAHPRRAA